MRPSSGLSLWISKALHTAGHLAGTQGTPVARTSERCVTPTFTHLLMGKANLESTSRSILKLENRERMGKCRNQGRWRSEVKERVCVSTRAIA